MRMLRLGISWEGGLGEDNQITEIYVDNDVWKSWLFVMLQEAEAYAEASALCVCIRWHCLVHIVLFLADRRFM